MAERTVSGRARDAVILADKIVLLMSRHWLLGLNLLTGLFIGGVVLAPLLMALRLEAPARLLYAFYGLNCHQLPQRSYFLFGSQGVVNTYPLADILAWSADPAYLRSFIGEAQIGYKMAIAHRNTAIYGTIFLGGLLFALVRRQVRPLSVRLCLLLIAPMFFDGVTHLISDLSGLSFRDTNDWLRLLTGGLLAPTFYAGDALGSLNWGLRTVTGALFGLAAVFLIYPHMERAFKESRQQLEIKLRRARVLPE